MFKKAEPKKTPKKPAATAKSQVSETMYNVTCDEKGNIKKIVPVKKK